MALHYTPSGRGRGPSSGHSALLLAGAVSDGSEQGDMLRDIANIRHQVSQSEACNDQSEDSSVSISPLLVLILIISWRNTMKSANKDAKHCTIRCLYLPFLCAGWLMYPDIRYLLFLFHSFPEFVPKVYLWRDDGKWKKWKMINLWKKWNIIELSWRVQMSETVIFLIQNSFKRYLSF